MPASRLELTKALIESYLQHRKDWWKLIDPENNEIKLPEKESTEYKKIAVCLDLLNRADRAVTTNDWLNFLYKLNDYAKDELETHQQRSWIMQFLAGQPMLLALVRSIREVIAADKGMTHKLAGEKASLIENQKELTNTIDVYKKNKETHTDEEITDLEKQLADVNSKLKALDATQGFREDYFAYIKKDEVTVKNEEKSFDDFSKSVENSKRLATFTARLNKAFSTAEGASESSNPSNTTGTLYANTGKSRKSKRRRDGGNTNSNNHHTSQRETRSGRRY